MKLLFLACLAAAAILAQRTSAPGGNLCNYPAFGDESNQDAVPIADFRTSGVDFIRPNWCITYCADRTSVKVAARFQFANQSTAVPTYKVRRHFTRETGMKVHLERTGGVETKRDDDPFNFCIDDNVSNTIDAVVNNFTDVTTMSEALNYYINKPGWAYLLYDLGTPPSIVVTDNVKQDLNYCEKFVVKRYKNGTYGDFQVFAGLIKAS